MPGFAVIIPAAGGSSRLGRPKQLVEFAGEALVRRTARAALESGATQVIVVVGSGAAEVTAALAGLAVQIVENPAWRDGMGTSLRCGADALNPDLDAALITLCDMPLVTAELIAQLAQAVAAGDPPLASAKYDSHFGPPCAFHRSKFQGLRSLDGDSGARAILSSAQDVAVFDFPGGSLDVDTPEDLTRLAKMSPSEGD